IEPVLDLTYQYILYYQRDFQDPILREIMGEEAAAKAVTYLANPEIREFLACTPVKFKSEGMTQVSQRVREVERIMAFMQLVGNAAKAVPQLAGIVNWQELLM